MFSEDKMTSLTIYIVCTVYCVLHGAWLFIEHLDYQMEYLYFTNVILNVKAVLYFWVQIINPFCILNSTDHEI